MTDDEIIQMMRDHFEGLFPKVCKNCGRHFASLLDYILNTKRIGESIFYDAELGDWETTEPIGGAAFVNCPCGTTLALTTEGMPLTKFHLVLNWIRIEKEQRGLSSVELSGFLRDQILHRVLADSDESYTEKTKRPNL